LAHGSGHARAAAAAGPSAGRDAEAYTRAPSVAGRGAAAAASEAPGPPSDEMLAAPACLRARPFIFQGAVYVDCINRPCFLCKTPGHTTATCPHRVDPVSQPTLPVPQTLNISRTSCAAACSTPIPASHHAPSWPREARRRPPVRHTDAVAALTPCLWPLRGAPCSCRGSTPARRSPPAARPPLRPCSWTAKRWGHTRRSRVERSVPFLAATSLAWAATGLRHRLGQDPWWSWEVHVPHGRSLIDHAFRDCEATR
jgi:hypothetical protein